MCCLCSGVCLCTCSISINISHSWNTLWGCDLLRNRPIINHCLREALSYRCIPLWWVIPTEKGWPTWSSAASFMHRSYAPVGLHRLKTTTTTTKRSLIQTQTETICIVMRQTVQCFESKAGLHRLWAGDEHGLTPWRWEHAHSAGWRWRWAGRCVCGSPVRDVSDNWVL